MSTITRNGAKLAHFATGSGEPVVLLHCSASSGGQWRALWDQLQERFRVIAPDLYGYGASDPWSGCGPITLAAEAEPVAALIARCREPVHLVGHSYGGAVALRLALDRPERLRSFTLIEPVAFHLLRQLSGPDAGLYEEIRALADAVLSAGLSGDYRRGMARFVDYWNGPGSWARLPEDQQLTLCRGITKIILDFRATIAEETPLEAYRRIGAPTLVLRGECSPATTRRIAELLARALPAARLRTVAGAGHMLPLSHREAVNSAIVEHLLHRAGPVSSAAA
jgi:pimeloyl-ACP methyl ester carboxylesterase